MRRYEVYQYSEYEERLIDIFHATDQPAREVRKSLINHDGYPSNISVYKLNETGAAFEDMARHTHPDEC